MAYQNSKHRSYAPRPIKSKYNINEFIKEDKVFVIMDDPKTKESQKIGEMSLDEALAKAKELGLDLVEVGPKNDPPVCKIIDFSKFLYITQKKAKKAKAKGKHKEVKGMRFPIFIDEGDIQHKLKRVREFLSKGHNVKLTVFLKGRTPPGQNEELMQRILTELEKDCKIDQPPKKEGRNLSVTVAPIKLQEEKDAKTKDTQGDKEKV